MAVTTDRVLAAAIALEEALIKQGISRAGHDLRDALTEFIGDNIDAATAIDSDAFLPVAKTRTIPEWTERWPADIMTVFNRTREQLLKLNRSLLQPLADLDPAVEMTPFPVAEGPPKARLCLRHGGATHRLHILDLDISTPYRAKDAIDSFEKTSTLHYVRARSGKTVAVGTKMTDRTTAILEQNGASWIDTTGPRYSIVVNKVTFARHAPSLPAVGHRLFAGANTRKVAEALVADPGHGTWQATALAEAAGVYPSAVTNARKLLSREAYVDFATLTVTDLDGLKAALDNGF